MPNCSPESISPDLAPYLNPKYWDGYVIGDRQLSDLTEVRVGPFSYQSSRFAVQSLANYINTMHTFFPIETKGSGEIFEPHDYEPGTVILFAQEALFQKGRGRISFQDFLHQELPVRPIELHPHLARDDSGGVAYADKAERIAYGSATFWGIVTPAKRSRNGLCGLKTSRVYKDEKGLYIGNMLALPIPIEIGKTGHLQGDKSEFLERTNRVAICSSGAPKRHRRLFWAKGFSGGIVPGEA